MLSSLLYREYNIYALDEQRKAGELCLMNRAYSRVEVDFIVMKSGIHNRDFHQMADRLCGSNCLLCVQTFMDKLEFNYIN